MAAKNDNDDTQCIEDSISDFDDTRSIESTISDTESIDSVTLLKRNRALWKVVDELSETLRACKDAMEKLIEKPVELLSKHTHVDLRADKSLLKESGKTLVEIVSLLREGVKTMRKALNEQSNKFNEFIFNGGFSNECSFDFEDSESLQKHEKDYQDSFINLSEEEDHRDCIFQQEKCLHDMRQNLFTANRPFVMRADFISQEERIYAKQFVDKYVLAMRQLRLHGACGPFREIQEQFYAKRYLENFVQVMKKKLSVAYGHIAGEAIMEDSGIVAFYLQVNDGLSHGHGIGLPYC